MPFARFELRTTDVEAAAAFYGPLLPAGLPDCTALAPDSLARGARPHWHVHLQVANFAAAAKAFTDAGATPLGPGGVSGFRDPSGAVMSLTEVAGPGRSDVGLVQHLGSPRARAVYSSLTGWLWGPVSGPHQPFGLASGGPWVGLFTDRTAYPLSHPHWLVCFTVPSFDSALSRVVASGGQSDAPLDIGGGALLSVCHDPQSATFGLRKPPA